MRILGTFFIILVLLRGVSYSCTSSLTMNLQTTSVNLNSNSFPNLRIRVQRSPTSASCSFFVVINNGGASSYTERALQSGAYQYPVQIYKDAARTQIIKDLAELTSLSDALSGTYSGGGTNFDVFYRPYIDTNTYNRFGSYSRTFTLRLYRGNLSSYTLTDTRTVTLNYTMAKKIDLSLVNTGASFNASDTTQTLNFGTLTQGATQSFDLVLNYNAGYNVSMSSANNNQLKRSSGSFYVPYQFEVNSSVVNLTSSASVVATATGVSALGGARFPIQVTIGSMLGTRSGSYSDTVTVSVASIE